MVQVLYLCVAGPGLIPGTPYGRGHWLPKLIPELGARSKSCVTLKQNTKETVRYLQLLDGENSIKEQSEEKKSCRDNCINEMMSINCDIGAGKVDSYFFLVLEQACVETALIPFFFFSASPSRLYFHCVFCAFLLAQ